MALAVAIMNEPARCNPCWLYDQPVTGPAVSIQTTLHTLEFKLYPNKEQERTLSRWLSKCCWLYNRALEMRSKAYKRRKESVRYNSQQHWLTGLRERIESVRLVPVGFARDALRRVDRGMKAFFRRCKAGEKKVGFPRFRSWRRYNSLECLALGNYMDGNSIRVPCLGSVHARGQFGEVGKQKLLRVVRRAHGWYAQVLIEQRKPEPLPETGNECGLDLGLTSFATLDSGEQIGNPRIFRKAEKKIRRNNKRLSRAKRGSNRRQVALQRLRRTHEKVQRQRRGFCHRLSRDLVNRFDRIAIENLNVKGLARTRLAKSVHDAAWSMFTSILIVKAENAGRTVVQVDPRGTSQTCPECGEVVAKKLSERTHRCEGCGFGCDRDQAAAMVIRQRAFRPARGEAMKPR